MISNEMSSTTKLYISSRSQHWFWSFFHLRSFVQFKNFKFQNLSALKKILGLQMFQMKSHQLQSCRSHKVCFHLILFKKIMNFIMLQHGYHRRIIQQAGGEKHLHRRFILQGGSDEEHIITAGWSCKPTMMMDYHCRLVVQTGCDDGLLPLAGKTKRR